MRRILIAITTLAAFGAIPPSVSEAEDASKHYAKENLKSDLKAIGRQSKEAAFSAGRTLEKGTRKAVAGIQHGVRHAGEGDSRNAARKTSKPPRQ